MLPVSRPVSNPVLRPALQAASIRDRVGRQALQDLAVLAASVCDAPAGFDMFLNKQDDCLKVVLRP